MANVPQVLISRQRHLSKVSAQQWLTSNGLDWNENILGASTQSENLPRNIYHYTLQALQLISDVAGVEPNLMAMPLAEDLNLPEQGRVSVQLKLGENATSIVLDYEQSAADFVLGVGNTATMIAVVGILAAVAIPAYQDYTVRAKVSEVIVATSATRVMLTEYYLANGKLPEQSDESYRGFSNAADIDFNAEFGAIEIIFNASIPQLEDAQINFQAYPSASDGIEWRCENVSAKESVVPSSCRN
jgi:type II secretory pathway pseudopilin PulG